jgi:hypothetical protein
MSRFPSSEDLWAAHEKRVLGVFMLALQMLREEKDLPAEENRINEHLALKAREANWRLAREQRGLTHAPVWEAQNPPQTEEDLGSQWLQTRPDFQCQLFDESDDDPKTAYRNYCIECKRLGLAPRSDWILNKNYVTEGIVRFLEASHSYGKGATSGAMIGYIQSMEPDDILREINEHILHILLMAHHPFRPLSFMSGRSFEEGILQMIQHLVRREVSPSSFDLRHLWVDLRR